MRAFGLRSKSGRGADSIAVMMTASLSLAATSLITSVLVTDGSAAPWAIRLAPRHAVNTIAADRRTRALAYRSAFARVIGTSNTRTVSGPP